MSSPVASPNSQMRFESLAAGGILVTLSGTWQMRAGEVDTRALFEAVRAQSAKAGSGTSAASSSRSSRSARASRSSSSASSTQSASSAAASPAAAAAPAADSASNTPAAPADTTTPAPTADAATGRFLRFDTASLGEWDSGLMVFLYKLCDIARESGLKIDYKSLPDGPARLLLLANAVPAVERSNAALREKYHPVFTRVGNLALWLGTEVHSMLTFLGLAVQSFGRFVRGKASYRRSDFFLLLQQTGVDALPIVALIAFLVGMIMAFVGAIQLQKFGADIFVADLVGLAMVREMGAMMTGIILCGRTGAAYAAQLGSMRIGEEIDALETFGISSMDFLVLPRILALTLMTPLLVIFADLIGIIGGMLIGVSLLDVTVAQFINRLQASLDLVQISTGIIKSVIFGILIALTGCLRGMQSGSSADEVGRVTTSAVVTGITAIIIADALFAVLFNIIGL